MPTVLAETTRGGMVESMHHGIVAVANPAGAIVASAGDVHQMIFYRSSAKPFQAIPVVESGAADRFGFTERELALCCASHSGQPHHQAEVRGMLAKIGLTPDALQCGFKLDGEELWPRIMAQYIAHVRTQAVPEVDPALLEALHVVPSYYLQYFYSTQQKLAEQAHWPPSRAETVMEIEAGLLRDYASPLLCEPPADLMKRGGAYYSTVATQLLNAHHNNLGETHIMNTRHNGAVAGWPADWVLELPCKVDRQGVHALTAEPPPPACFALLAQVKMYELLMMEAAVRGDRAAAYQALITNPLGPQPAQADAMLDDILQTHHAQSAALSTRCAQPVRQRARNLRPSPMQ